VKLYFSCN